MDVSSQSVDNLINSSFRASLLILLASILALVLLMANHFRFVGYAVLLKKMEEVDRLKNDFLSVATHELKTPMSVIKGYISMILEGVEGEVAPKIKDTLHKVFEQTDRLNKLVMDLLDVSRIEQGRTKFEMADVTIKDVIESVISDLSKLAEDKGLKITYNPPQSLPLIRADLDRVREIFTNLLSNAIKYSEKGEITVTHQVGRTQLKTAVEDTGIGMSEKDQAKLFSRFYRIRNDKTENISGTGLGLWIIKQYIDKMGGSVTVNSTENVGSTFTITLPIASTQPAKD